MKREFIIDVREFVEFTGTPPKENAITLPMSKFELWKNVLDKNNYYYLIFFYPSY